MAENPNWAARSGAATTDTVDEGLRSFMLGVYNYMAGGLAITGLVAWFVAHSPAMMQAIFGTPLQWVVFLAPLALVFWLSSRIQSMPVGRARALFFVYAGLIGVMLSTIFLVYTGASITMTFFTTAAAFAGLSLVGYTTKRDLTGMGSFLVIGLIGILVAMVVNFFLKSSGLDFAISVGGVLIFAGLTAFDSQRIKEMYYAGDAGEMAARKSIIGALRLYLDFINLFLFLLRLMGNRR